MRIKGWLLATSLMMTYPGYSFGSSGSITVDALQQSKSQTVKGVVLDEMGPVTGASVVIKGTTKGVITDLNGEFELEVPKGSTLVISFIGYKDKEIVYKGEKNLKIKMNEDVTQLEEVQVIAYGATKKVTVTGAISSMKSEELIKAPVGSVANALAGKIPGLSSVQESGQPGADNAQIYVRGVGSLTEGGSAPLCLVDGVERSFTQIDANEIDDITVLKDASATAVFGVRGANGVILITTKRGQKGKAKVSFSTSAAMQIPTRIPEFANSYDWATTYNQAQVHDGVKPELVTFKPDVLEAYRTGSNPLIFSDTNWTDMMIKSHAWQTQHNFNISGGSERVRYFGSLGVYTQAGLFNTFDTDEYATGFNYNRYNYRVNMDVDVTKTTQLKINLGGLLSDKREPNYNNGTYTAVKFLFRDLYSASPLAGPGIVDGKWISPNLQIVIPGIPGAIDGLGSYYGRGYNTNDNNTINFDLSLQQKLDFITKGLKMHLKGAYNSGVSTSKRRESSAEHYESFIDNDGKTMIRKMNDKSTLGYKDGHGQSRNWYLEAALNYKRDFKDHHVSALLMYNQSMNYYYGGGYDAIPRAYVGLVGRATYDYKTRYMADFSVGYNGSENFAEGKRFGAFPAGSVGWIVSEEKFMKSLKPFVSYLKLRGSWGLVGSDRGGGRFIYLPDVYNLSTGSYSFGSSNNFKVSGSNEARVGNPNVSWETAFKQNYGVDLHFFDSRLKTTFDYFIEHRKDILISRNINPGYLAIKLPIYNLGKVDNKGFEVTARWDDKFQDVRYYVGGSVSYAKNKIVYNDEIPQPYEWMRRTGRPVGQSFGWVTDGFFSEEDVKNYASTKGQEGGIPDHGTGFTPSPGDVKYKDLNGDGLIDHNDNAAIGNPRYPLLTANLNAGFSWKGFDFSMTWSGAFKTSRMVGSFFRIPFGSNKNGSLLSYMIEDAWTPEKGNASKAPAISLSKSVANNYRDSDLWLRDASYVRLKNIELGYSLPKSVISKLKLNTLRFSVSGYNLLTFDGLKVCDPEANPEGTAYPLIKVVNFGLKIGF